MFWNPMGKSIKANKNLNKRSTRFKDGVFQQDKRKGGKFELNKPEDQDLTHIIRSNETYKQAQKIKSMWTMIIVITVVLFFLIYLFVGFFRIIAI